MIEEIVACISEHRKCWGAWDTTCGHKTRDITPSIAWSREAWNEEALDDLPWKDERIPSSIRRIIWNCFKSMLRKFWETECSAYGLFRTHRYHLELNWTELRTHIETQARTHARTHTHAHSRTPTHARTHTPFFFHSFFLLSIDSKAHVSALSVLPFQLFTKISKGKMSMLVSAAFKQVGLFCKQTNTVCVMITYTL